MGDTLRHYWTDAQGYQKFLYVVGTVLLLNGLVHLGVILVTGGSWQGPISWRKPITFSFSFAITCWTLGWILSYFTCSSLDRLDTERGIWSDQPG